MSLPVTLWELYGCMAGRQHSPPTMASARRVLDFEDSSAELRVAPNRNVSECLRVDKPTCWACPATLSHAATPSLGAPRKKMTDYATNLVFLG